MTTTLTPTRRRTGPAAKPKGTAGDARQATRIQEAGLQARDKEKGVRDKGEGGTIITVLKELVVTVAEKVRHFELCEDRSFQTLQERWMTIDEARTLNAELRRNNERARWIVVDALPVESGVAA